MGFGTTIVYNISNFCLNDFPCSNDKHICIYVFTINGTELVGEFSSFNPLTQNCVWIIETDKLLIIKPILSTFNLYSGYSRIYSPALI